MLEGGEDARFIARRLVILASEDVGLADPSALGVADAAARAVEFVGLPEAQLNLAQAVVYLAVRTQVEPGHDRARGGPGPTPGRDPAPTSPRISATPITTAATRSATVRGTGIPMTTPAAGSNRTTVLRRWPGASTTSRATTAPKRRSENACGGVGRGLDAQDGEDEPLILTHAGHRRRIAAVIVCVAVSGSLVAQRARRCGTCRGRDAGGAQLGAQLAERAHPPAREQGPAPRAADHDGARRRRAQATRPGRTGAFDTAVSTPGSPSFRHYLDPGQFAAEFGPERADHRVGPGVAGGPRPAGGADVG